MGIPYGTQYTATVSGSAINEVECENCKTTYVYRVERQSSASSTSILWLDNQGAKDRSSEAAYSALEAELRKAVDPVACPTCGWFQDNMCHVLKRKRLHIALWVALPIAVILLIWGLVTINNPDGYSKILLILSGSIAAAGFIIGIIWSKVHSPNQNHPGPSGKHEKLASESTGTLKADFEAANTIARQQWEEKFHRYLLHSMIHMSSADGSIEEEELESVSKIYQQVTEDELTIDELRETSQEQKAAKAELLQNLNQFSANLTDEAKELFIRAGVAIAVADSEFEDAEWKVLIEIGQALNMTQQHFDAVLESMQEK